MTAQRGRDVLVKINDGDGFTTVAGLRTKALNFNTRTVDITHSDSVNAWRELLPGAGVKTAEISGTGIFLDSVSDQLVRGAFFEQSIPEFQVTIPDFGILTGMFQVSSLNYAGNYQGEANYEITLTSAGTLSFDAI